MSFPQVPYVTDADSDDDMQPHGMQAVAEIERLVDIPVPGTRSHARSQSPAPSQFSAEDARIPLDDFPSDLEGDIEDGPSHSGNLDEDETVGSSYGRDAKGNPINESDEGSLSDESNERAAERGRCPPSCRCRETSSPPRAAWASRQTSLESAEGEDPLQRPMPPHVNPNVALQHGTLEDLDVNSDEYLSALTAYVAELQEPHLTEAAIQNGDIFLFQPAPAIAGPNAPNPSWLSDLFVNSANAASTPNQTETPHDEARRLARDLFTYALETRHFVYQLLIIDDPQAFYLANYARMTTLHQEFETAHNNIRNMRPDCDRVATSLRDFQSAREQLGFVLGLSPQFPQNRVHEGQAPNAETWRETYSLMRDFVRRGEYLRFEEAGLQHQHVQGRTELYTERVRQNQDLPNWMWAQGALSEWARYTIRMIDWAFHDLNLSPRSLQRLRGVEDVRQERLVRATRTPYDMDVAIAEPQDSGDEM